MEQLTLFAAPTQPARSAVVVVPAAPYGPHWRHHTYCPASWDPDDDSAWVGGRRMPVETVTVRGGLL